MTTNTQLATIVTEHELGELAALIEQRTGILFDETRQRFFSLRIQEHMAHKKLVRGLDLLRAIKSSNVEYEALLERLLTQETSFFRYPHIFEVLERKILPEMHVKKFWENPRALRIWCAGCSTGEEPYSVAVTLSEALEFADSWKLHILATDISRRALQHAERGVYTRRALGQLTPKQIESSFAKVGDQFMVKPKVRNLVSFVPMNLVDGTYMGRFDVIFCMNVMIYFSDERRAAVIQRLHDALEPGGYLFMGHAESMNNPNVKFETIVHRDVRLYQKPGNNVARWPVTGSEACE